MKFLFYDETDAGEATGEEGNPISLATMRTQQYRDRKRFCASTPVMKDGPISTLYAESDARVYETPCPHCGEFFELTWATIQWPEGDPAAAYAVCPHNGCVIEELHKAAMVDAGRWRATNPAVTDHAGFLLRTLVSLNYNARWGQLAREFIAAKRDPETLRTFVNLVLAEGWEQEPGGPDMHELAARAEPIGLDRMPPEVMWLTAGVDVQDDRLEVAIVGHQRDGETAVLGYRVLWGPIDGEEVWRDLDALLRETWPHPGGARIGISAAAVDGGDGDHLPHVEAFCRGRFGRRVVRIKGVPGFARAPLQRSSQKGRPVVHGGRRRGEGRAAQPARPGRAWCDSATPCRPSSTSSYRGKDCHPLQPRAADPGVRAGEGYARRGPGRGDLRARGEGVDRPAGRRARGGACQPGRAEGGAAGRALQLDGTGRGALGRLLSNPATDLCPTGSF